MPNYKSRGLFERYNYERTDGKPLDRSEEVFALRFDKDDAWGAACRTTLREFAGRIEQLGYGPLASDLRERIDEVESRIAQEREQEPEVIPVPQL